MPYGRNGYCRSRATPDAHPGARSGAGLGLELLHHERIRRVEVLEARELVVIDLDLILALDRRHDLDTHHRVDSELLERRPVGDLVLLGDLGDESPELFSQIRAFGRAFGRPPVLLL